MQVDTKINQTQQDIWWFGKGKYRSASKNKTQAFKTRQQFVVPRVNSTTRVYWLNGVGGHRSYTVEQFFNEPKTNYEAATPDTSDPDTLNEYYYASLKSGEHVAEYGDDVNATSFEEGTPWGLRELPDCLLNMSNKGKNLRGLTTPFAYFAFGGSSFVLHTEDQNLCSVSRLIRGAKKAWFVLPPEFLAALQRWFYEDFKNCPTHLCHKSLLAEPDLLREAGFPVLEIDQDEGEFVITFPGALHQGHNRGRNYAEAINFGTHEWLRHGLGCEKKKCSLRNQCRTSIPYIPIDKIAKQHDPELYKQFVENGSKWNESELMPKPPLPDMALLKQLSELHNLGLVN